jgi:diguanylate cyclase (GGDEF)-like protein
MRDYSRSGTGPLDFDQSPRALVLLYRLLNLDEVERVRDAVVEGVEWLVYADAVSLWEPAAGGLRVSARRGSNPDAVGRTLERHLVGLPGSAHSSLDRSQDPEIERTGAQYRHQGRLCHVRPLRAFGERVGSIALHCFGRRELTHGELQALRQFGDAAGVALRSAYEREELRRLAYTDPLTGLGNRRRIEDVLAAAHHPVAILFIDFDGLKGVNDHVGYDVGDRVIQAIGGLLQGRADETWIPGRLGGDEFVVVLPGATPDSAAHAAAELAARLETLAVPVLAQSHFRGASVGWAVSKPSESDTNLLRRASVEMKEAKSRRRRERA